MKKNSTSDETTLFSEPAESGSMHEHAHHEAHAHAHHHSVQDQEGEQGLILTVRASSGLSGDMMLAGLVSMARLTQQQLESLVGELKLPALKGSVAVGPRSVNHIAGVGCNITLPHEHEHRTLRDIRTIIADSLFPSDAKDLAINAFALLADAEAAVHGTEPDAVSFHEVGALDSILDTCLACRIFTLIKPARFVCSPLPLADGVIRCAHGLVPSPAPAVLRMLEGIPVSAFKGEGETVTPTALCLLKALGAEFGGWPDMVVERTIISYGSKVFANAPNGAVWALGR